MKIALYHWIVVEYRIHDMEEKNISLFTAYTQDKFLSTPSIYKTTNLWFSKEIKNSNTS